MSTTYYNYGTNNGPEFLKNLSRRYTHSSVVLFLTNQENTIDDYIKIQSMV